MPRKPKSSMPEKVYVRTLLLNWLAGKPMPDWVPVAELELAKAAMLRGERIPITDTIGKVTATLRLREGGNPDSVSDYVEAAWGY